MRASRIIAFVGTLLAATFTIATVVTDQSAIANGQTFDFVIVGAGLAGLTVANKLSAQNYSTLVMEAGPDGSWNNAVKYAGSISYPPTFCNRNYLQYDEKGHKLPKSIHAGGCIGGSTSINGMLWYRPTRAEIDRLETLGNPGWNWDTLEPLMEAIERNIPPNEEQILQGASYDPNVHGYHGVVNTSFPTPMRIPGAVRLYKRALPEAFPGLSIGNDLSNRTSFVSASSSWTMWLEKSTGKMRRCSAADALLWAPSQQRQSLTVLANHTVTRVLFDHDKAARGVAFADSTSTRLNRQIYQVRARKSVILAAGALGSAPILERSGIGNPNILAAAKIQQVVDLPGVGANLNDQPGSAVSALVSKRYHNDTSIIDGRNIFGPEISLVNIDQIWPSMPVAEVVAESKPTALDAPFWPLMPLSRGHIHIASSDPFQNAIITPRFLTDTFDQAVGVAVARRIRNLFSNKAFHGVVENAYQYPPLGLNATDSEYLDWFKDTAAGASHWLGSTAMLPRALGGVVDSRLR
ncbi:Glucose oxidase [Beauveria bassiana D1-5]|uniref:Glucose oxidase n=1 Tax=Beauveria bassiana D1-5 TaxID=1245745 RepID=A0A0A2W2R2_BEABA|nr:Glucose oxidase [Beauveria bassiana D1-5]